MIGNTRHLRTRKILWVFCVLGIDIAVFFLSTRNSTYLIFVSHLRRKRMKNIYLKGNRGFTLIELLIVVALLGILIVGMIAAIDPVEQINKGRDTALEAMARDYIDAQNRYFANNQQYTWAAAAPAGTVLLSTRGGNVDFGGTGTLNSLGELKSTYGVGANNVANLTKISLTGTTSTITLCFAASSRTVHSTIATYTDASGGTGAACPTATMATACYVCLR
jgi:prepilin-type N-terminal cleavage/methylation domain-containing protein